MIFRWVVAQEVQHICRREKWREETRTLGSLTQLTPEPTKGSVMYAKLCMRSMNWMHLDVFLVVARLYYARLANHFAAVRQSAVTIIEDNKHTNEKHKQPEAQTAFHS